MRIFPLRYPFQFACLPAFDVVFKLVVVDDIGLTYSIYVDLVSSWSVGFALGALGCILGRDWGRHGWRRRRLCSFALLFCFALCFLDGVEFVSITIEYAFSLLLSDALQCFRDKPIEFSQLLGSNECLRPIKCGHCLVGAYRWYSYTHNDVFAPASSAKACTQANLSGLR